MPVNKEGVQVFRAEFVADMDSRLRARDAALYERTRDKLVVNQPKRKVPHYQFVPSLHHPDPAGIASYRVEYVHKKSGKR